MNSEATLIGAGQQTAQVYTIESLAEIDLSQPQDTLFFFDLDDTIFDSSNLVGSKAWRKYMKEITKQRGMSKNWHDILTYFLAQTYPMQTAEPLTSQFVKDLQEQGYVACGLTARERNCWYDTPQEGVDAVTIKQLLSVNVDFNHQSLENNYPDLVQDSEYYQGTFFANADSKGQYVLRLFAQSSKLPSKVIFIDDKLNQVESVAEALTKLGIDHDCYYYTATDAKAKTFDPLIANLELYYFCTSFGQNVLLDAEALKLAREDAGKNADFYLEKVLDFAESNEESFFEFMSRYR